MLSLELVKDKEIIQEGLFVSWKIIIKCKRKQRLKNSYGHGIRYLETS